MWLSTYIAFPPLVVLPKVTTGIVRSSQALPENVFRNLKTYLQQTSKQLLLLKVVVPLLLEMCNTRAIGFRILLS